MDLRNWASAGGLVCLASVLCAAIFQILLPFRLWQLFRSKPQDVAGWKAWSCSVSDMSHSYLPRYHINQQAKPRFSLPSSLCCW
ncbi:hypothetical protein F4818DRAFT_426291 [Hypoxylon cercidicola]|nr:hypothetical protein F4818DRAFT_426291 [Hypoxylon cercidicola]